MTKVQRNLLIVGVIVILFCGGLFWLASSKTGDLLNEANQDAAKAGDIALTSIAAEWEYEELMRFASATYFANNTEAETLEWLETMKEQLGPFQEGAGYVEQIVPTEDLRGDTALGCVYHNEAQFEKTKAKIEMVMILRMPEGEPVGDWSVASIGVTALD